MRNSQRPLWDFEFDLARVVEVAETDGDDLHDGASLTGNRPAADQMASPKRGENRWAGFIVFEAVGADGGACEDVLVVADECERVAVVGGE